MPTSPDGSAVEIFCRLPAGSDLDVIDSLIAPCSSVLDLGAGAGRLADPLAELGHQVTAVDESADMLSHVRSARTVQATFAELRLPERFDAVVMAGCLLNYLGRDVRHAALTAAARHLKPSGVALIQWRFPQWFAMRTEGRHSMVGSTGVQTMTIHTSRDGVVAGDFGLEVDGRVFSQPFAFHLLPTAQLLDELRDADLGLDTPEPGTTEWLQARPRHTEPS
ncbi:class I SAM-dependent methyltransferase [Mycobacterium camsae]|uniref:class I SAM-dependent methyltransferase n=1 Tax=Mycobacterium gordonae TaxID=1778 RepID=UPI001980F4BF|nr:class I SAM-dependent methyltransferase [Mycobacterium gordonae]